jgi:hypothetical protein
MTEGAMGLIGTGIGAVGSIFGMAKAARERRKNAGILAQANKRLDVQEGTLGKRQSALDSWFTG